MCIADVGRWSVGRTGRTTSSVSLQLSPRVGVHNICHPPGMKGRCPLCRHVDRRFVPCLKSIVSLPCLSFSHEGGSMLRRLPPLNALKAFEAAARHESFTRAAEELCVTQGAVSHQVKALEAELAVKLFNRERQRLIITEAGRDYLTVVRDALDRIAIGTERLLQRQNAGVLTVSTSPDF